MFRFEDPEPSSIIEAVDMVKQSIETVNKNTLSELKTLKFYMGVKLNVLREGQVRYGSMRQSSASLRPISAGTPGASVWPSPRQMPGPSSSP